MTFENSTEKGKQMPVQSIWQLPKNRYEVGFGIVYGLRPFNRKTHYFTSYTAITFHVDIKMTKQETIRYFCYSSVINYIIQ